LSTLNLNGWMSAIRAHQDATSEEEGSDEEDLDELDTGDL